MDAFAEWIAVDWGTSRLRVWAMQGETPVADASSCKGMSRLAKNEFEPALMELIADWVGEQPATVVACGMVGARQGWVEAPYSAVPSRPLPKTPVRVPDTGPLINAFVVPGLKQPSPPDVMRGEETQIAGFLSRNPGWDGIICLPGTHTKWAHVSADEVVSFQTFMTGELFQFLSENSVLRHTVGSDWDQAAFLEAVDDTLSRPERLAADLFRIRSRDLLQAQGGNSARARLSGLLIGAELAAARPYWLGQQVAIFGAKNLATAYSDALLSKGVPVVTEDGEKMTLAGLAAARKLLGDTP